MTDYRIPLFWPHIPESLLLDLRETLSTRWIGQGPKVEEFEHKIGKKFGLGYPLMTNSGTSALELAYDLIGVGPGDEVVTTVLTCTATNIPLLRRGAKLVFADIDPESLVITNGMVEKVITRRTKAIVGVSLGGIQCDLGGFDVPVVIDAAQAVGHNNGDYLIYSFQAIKHFTTADGGLLNCPDEETHHRAKLLRWFGIDRDRKRAYDWQAYKEREMTFDIEVLGYKFQPTDVAATFGLAGLRDYDYILAYRKSIFDIYKSELNNQYGITIVDGKNNVCWLATLLVDDRDGLVRWLDGCGIETNLVQIRNDLFKVFGGERRDLPNMNAVEGRYLSIPINTKITLEDAHEVADRIQQYYRLSRKDKKWTPSPSSCKNST